MAPRLPAAARREQLLDVAVAVFARHGYHGTSMKQVAEAAGVTKPVLYQHFASKRDLHLALVDDVAARLRTAIGKATADEADSRGQTEVGFRAYFRWVAQDNDAFGLLFGDGHRDDQVRAAVQRLRDDVADAIAPLITADIEVAHQRVLAHALVGLAEGISRYLVRAGTPFDPDTVARQASDLAWAGLRAAHR